MLNWDDLRYFLAFARMGSMGAAAKALGVNQSTVQRRLAELGKSLGRQLVANRPGGYRLTEAGIGLLRSAECIEEAVVAFQRELAAGDRSLLGTVRMTTTSMIACRLRSSQLIDKFRGHYPDLRLELLITDRCLDLSRGEADLALRSGESKDENLIGRKIADVPWAVYASGSYIERHGAPKCAEEIGRHFVVTCCDTEDHPATRWLKSVAPNATIAARCDTGDEQVRIVKSGVGIAALLACDRDNDLVRVIDSINLTTPYYLLMHKDMQHTPRVRAFADFVASEVKAFRTLVFE